MQAVVKGEEYVATSVWIHNPLNSRVPKVRPEMRFEGEARGGFLYWGGGSRHSGEREG